MKAKWFDGKTVVITGASSGFGKLLSEKLIKNHNCKVIGIARTQSKLEDLKAILGDNFTFSAFDVGDKSKWLEFSDYLTKQNIQVDILINNAGVLPPFAQFKNQPIADVISSTISITACLEASA